MNVMVGESVIIRLKAILIFLCLLAPVIVAHKELLPFSKMTNDLIELTCFCLLGLNNPVVGMFSDRKSEQNITVTPVVTVQPGEKKL